LQAGSAGAREHCERYGSPMKVSARPNQSRIRARVASFERAADGWGGWAELDVISVSAGAEGRPPRLEGKQVRAFVPPPLVHKLSTASEIDAAVTWHGGPDGGFYSLVPP